MAGFSEPARVATRRVRRNSPWYGSQPPHLALACCRQPFRPKIARFLEVNLQPARPGVHVDCLQAPGP